jgi:general secretion pathway protein K
LTVPAADTGSDHDRPTPRPVAHGQFARGERGLALLAVLWVVALLSVMALDVLAAARRESATAEDLAARARLDAAADAGLTLGIHALLQVAAEPGPRRGEAPFRPGSPPIEERFAGVRLSITIEDESGKIDLNQSESRLIAALFEALGVPRPRADELAGAIQDWRDQNDVPERIGGAEWPQYRAAGRAIPPRNGNFMTVEELVHVLGMTPELHALAAPSLTVHGQSQAPDRETASALVLRVMGAGGRAAPATRRAGAGGAALSPLAGRAYRIEVEATAAEARRRRSAIVRVTGDARDPYWIQEYR